MVDLDTVNASWALSACVPVSFLRYILTFFGGMPDSRTSYRDQLSRATVAARLDSGPPGECIDFFFEIPTRPRRPVTAFCIRCEHEGGCVLILACGWPASATGLVDSDSYL